MNLIIIQIKILKMKSKSLIRIKELKFKIILFKDKISRIFNFQRIIRVAKINSTIGIFITWLAARNWTI